MSDAPVTLRALAARDEALYCAIYTDPSMLAQVGPPLDAAAARRSFRAALRASNRARSPRRLWVIEEGGEDAGIIGLLPGDEVGCMVLLGRQGRGVSRRATQALAHLAFTQLGVRHLRARCTYENASAIAVLARAGFRREPDTADEVRWSWPAPDC